MEFKKNSADSILNKLTRFLSGFLASIMTIVILLKISSSYWGIFAGLIISGAAGVYLFKKGKKSYKTVAYGVLTSTAFVTIAAIVIWIFVYSAFQGIAN